MFCVVYYGGGASRTSLQVYGGWSTWDEANAWIGNQLNPGLFSVVTVLGPAALGPPGNYVPQTFIPGNIVVAFVTYSAVADQQCFLYGVFPNWSAAQQWIGNRQFPGGYQVVTVLQFPAVIG